MNQRPQNEKGILIQDTRRMLEFYAVISRVPCSCGGRATIGYDGMGRISQVFPVCTLCGEEIDFNEENRKKLEDLLGETGTSQ